MFFRSSPSPLALPRLQHTEVCAPPTCPQFSWIPVRQDTQLFSAPIRKEDLERLFPLPVNKSHFPFNVRKKLLSTTFLQILDYGDVVYQHAPSYLLSSLDALYHGALRFITDCKFLTHHCELYERVAWPSLRILRKMPWHLLIYKAILGHLPNYLCCLFVYANSAAYLGQDTPGKEILISVSLFLVK